MKMFKMILVVCALLVIGLSFFNASAEKPTESPRFQSGVMGEIFAGLAGAGGAGGQSIITAAELVGEWTCDAFGSVVDDPMIDEAWSAGSEGLFLQYFGGSIFFNDDGDGSFSISLPDQDPFHLITTDITETPSYVVVGDTMYRKCYIVYYGETYSSIASFSIKRITQNIMIFKFLHGPGLASKVVVCQRVLN